MKNKIISLMLASLMLLALVPFSFVSASAASDKWDGTVAVSFASGDGTEKNPYIIKTAEQLAYLAFSVNSGKNSYEDQYIRLEADIVLNDTSSSDWTKNAKEWTPIGFNENNEEIYFTGVAFYGNFDGKKHTISGLYITDEEHFVGLFGTCKNAVISNLTVSEAYIEGVVAGGVTGLDNYGQYENCHFSGAIKSSKAESTIAGIVGSGYYVKSFIGCTAKGSISALGIAGGIVSATDDTVIENCKNEAAIVADTYSVMSDDGTVHYYGGRAGGIAGDIDSNAKVTNCENTGTVTAVGYAGGIVGDASSSSEISKCVNNADISYKIYSEDLAACAGGILGKGYGKVNDCINNGNVVGKVYVGGIAGESQEITNCTNNGSVSGDRYIGGVVGTATNVKNCVNNGEVSGNYSVGGVVGKCYSGGIVKNCRNNGRVDAVIYEDSDGYYFGGIAGSSGSNVERCVNNAAVNGDFYVGGIVGNISKALTVVADCINKAEDGIHGNEFVGGIIGDISWASTVERCANLSAVSANSVAGGVVAYSYWSYTVSESETKYYNYIFNCYNAGDVSSNDYSGGIVGVARDTIFANSYNVGKITVTAVDEYKIAVAGNATARVSGFYSFENCYFGDDMLPAALVMTEEYDYLYLEAPIEGTTMLSAEQMESADSYVGFDFEEIWVMDEETEYAYPELREPKPEYMLGDVNGDNVIDQFDYVLVKRAYFDTYEFKDGEEERADVNHDDVVDQYDYVLLKRVYFGTYTITE